MKSEMAAMIILSDCSQRFAKAPENTTEAFMTWLSGIIYLVQVANMPPTTDMVDAVMKLVEATRNNITA